MLRVIALQAALVAACSSPAHPTDRVSSSTPSPAIESGVTPPADAFVVDAAVDAGMLTDAPIDAPKKLGAHGAVCRLGFRHEKASGPPYPVECAPGLHCCYPCGIQGCDYTCMTQAECNVRRP